MNDNNHLTDDRLALMTVFNGTEAPVLARLLVLRAVVGRRDAPFWTASEPRDRLAFRDEAKLEKFVRSPNSEAVARVDLRR